jgi:HEAT repeat protein
MGSSEQPVAFYAYQSLQEHILRASAPGREEDQRALVAALGEALTAPAKTKAGGAQPASFGNNPFLNAVASQRPSYEHTPAVRTHLARLLGLLPQPSAVPYLAKALDDLDAREMARCSLEANSSAEALDALLRALNAAGSTFRIGVLNSLAKRRDPRSAPALKAAAQDPHPDVRIAALYALAALADTSADTLLEKAARSEHAAESRAAHICRIRLAANVLAAGDRNNAARLYKLIASSDAPEPQKMAARVALASL